MPRRKNGIEFIGVGVGAVILNASDEVLLLRRASHPEIGQWTIPGGAVEWFETCADAVKRECREEVGLNIEVGRMLTVVDHILEDEGEHWVSVEFLCSVTSDKAARLCERESSELGWFSLDALPDPMTQPTREALASYRRLSKD